MLKLTQCSFSYALRPLHRLLKVDPMQYLVGGQPHSEEEERERESLWRLLHMLRGPNSFPRSLVGRLDGMPHPPARTRTEERIRYFAQQSVVWRALGSQLGLSIPSGCYHSWVAMALHLPVCLRATGLGEPFPVQRMPHAHQVCTMSAVMDRRSSTGLGSKKKIS